MNGGTSAWTKGGINTLASSGSNTSMSGVGTSTRTGYKILVYGSAGMLLWGSMATCAREGFGTSNEDGVFTVIGESIGGGEVSIIGCNCCRWGQWLNKKQPL